MRARPAFAAAFAALALAGCGGDDGDEGMAARVEPQATAERTTETRESRPAGTTVRNGASQFGPVLFAGRRRAVYYFAKEKQGRSECYGECAKAWPPVLTRGRPRAGNSARQSLLETTRRRDGTSQVTYNGRPLYYYVNEPRGRVLCHNVTEFGGLWLAVRASGEPVS